MYQKRPGPNPNLVISTPWPRTPSVPLCQRGILGSCEVGTPRTPAAFRCTITAFLCRVECAQLLAPSITPPVIASHSPRLARRRRGNPSFIWPHPAAPRLLRRFAPRNDTGIDTGHPRTPGKAALPICTPTLGGDVTPLDMSSPLRHSRGTSGSDSTQTRSCAGVPPYRRG